MIIEINTQDVPPIYEQLRNQIVFGIAAGKLVPNESLPSARSLAADLGINFHTVNKAYTMLYDEGYLVMDRRRGALVAQIVERNNAFDERLKSRLALFAAEAVCRGMSKNSFLEICAGCYQKVTG